MFRMKKLTIGRRVCWATWPIMAICLFTAGVDPVLSIINGALMAIIQYGGFVAGALTLHGRYIVNRGYLLFSVSLAAGCVAGNLLIEKTPVFAFACGGASLLASITGWCLGRWATKSIAPPENPPPTTN